MKQNETELLCCPLCQFDKKAFDKHKKMMEPSAYFHETIWDKYKPVLYKDRLTQLWIVECQNCGVDFLYHSNKEGTITWWNSLPRNKEIEK